MPFLFLVMRFCLHFHCQFRNISFIPFCLLHFFFPSLISFATIGSDNAVLFYWFQIWISIYDHFCSCQKFSWVYAIACVYLHLMIGSMKLHQWFSVYERFVWIRFVWFCFFNRQFNSLMSIASNAKFILFFFSLSLSIHAIHCYSNSSLTHQNPQISHTLLCGTDSVLTVFPSVRNVIQIPKFKAKFFRFISEIFISRLTSLITTYMCI